jgi:hypothetical protein
MDKLDFEGTVVNGLGTHRELLVPGRALLPQAPTDWPETLHPGSLNLKIASYPPAWSGRGMGNSVRGLDLGTFLPLFVISQDELGNNLLTPTPSKPKRGIGQVWRASLAANGGVLDCWILRRIDSDLRDVLELVSGYPIRSRMGLARTRDWPATVTVYGHWPA